MSVFYDLASLVLVPSGYKASKVYAQKPLTTDGQLTFSRASTATRVNSAGLIETVSSNVPRLDYLGSTCPKLQLEPSRTNVITFSDQIDNAAFIGSTPVTANAGVSPDGNTNADAVKESATTAFHIKGQSQSFTSGTAYTFSFFAKADGRSFARVLFGNAPFTTNESAYYNLTTGATSSSANCTASMVNYGNGWWRCVVTATANATASDAIYFGPARNMTDGYNTYAGNASLGILCYGIQQEAAAYATSYIPTTTAAVTRLADAASKTGISSLIGQTEGTLFIDLSEVNDLDSPEITIDNNNNTDRIVLTRSSVGNWGIFVASSAAATYSVYSTTSSASGKFALAYSSAGYALYRNGVQIVTGTYDLPAALSAIRFNGRSTSDFYATKKVGQTLLFKTRLTNAQLAEITQL